MNPEKRQVRIAFALAIKSVIWSFSTCVPVNKEVQLSPWDDEDTRWIHNLFSTKSPSYWTVTPYDFGDKSGSVDSKTYVAVIFGAMLFGLLVVLCKYFLCEYTGSSSSDSTATLHPPPSRTIAPSPIRIQTNLGNNAAAWNTGTTYGASQGTSSNFTNGGSEAPHNANEKPPGYSDVVLSDFMNKEIAFPKVPPNQFETPPPKYDDYSLPKY